MKSEFDPPIDRSVPGNRAGSTARNVIMRFFILLGSASLDLAPE